MATRSLRSLLLHLFDAACLLLARCSCLNGCQIGGRSQGRYLEAIPRRSILRLRASTNAMLRRRYSV
jgi:hypothetical protein